MAHLLALCANPHHSEGMSKYSTSGPTQYAPNNFNNNPPPYDVTLDDVSAPL